MVSGQISIRGIAIVTGAAQGIGRSVALRLADDGFDVAVNDLPSKKDIIDSVVNEIQLKGRRSLAALADVTEDGDVKAMVATVVTEFGGLDVVGVPRTSTMYYP